MVLSGFVHRAHPTGSQNAENLVTADPLGRLLLAFGLGGTPRFFRDGRELVVEGIACFFEGALMRPKPGLDLGSNGVLAATRLGDVRRARRACFLLQRTLEDAIDLGEVLRGAHDSSPMCTRSHARAAYQCRWTVAGAISRTRPISFAFMPL